MQTLLECSCNNRTYNFSWCIYPTEMHVFSYFRSTISRYNDPIRRVCVSYTFTCYDIRQLYWKLQRIEQILHPWMFSGFSHWLALRCHYFSRSIPEMLQRLDRVSCKLSPPGKDIPFLGMSFPCGRENHMMVVPLFENKCGLYR